MGRESQRGAAVGTLWRQTCLYPGPKLASTTEKKTEKAVWRGAGSDIAVWRAYSPVVEYGMRRPRDDVLLHP